MAGITDTTEPYPFHGGLPGRDWGASVVVWGVWALMLLALVLFVGRFSYNGPGSADELSLETLARTPPCVH
jgi:hypothetical protein